MSARKLSHHQIRPAVLGLVGRTYADVLTECLYWSQHGKGEIDGRQAFWKSGQELSVKLGMSARTASMHLKHLAKLGWWELHYRPRPGRPSPVTWLVPSEATLRLISELATSAELDAQKKLGKRTLKGEKLEPSKGKKYNGQVSEIPTPKQILQASKTASDQEESFLLSEKQEKGHGTNETFLSKSTEGVENVNSDGKADVIKSPKWMKTKLEDAEFLTDIQLILAEMNKPLWDELSQFTWRHVSEACSKLHKLGIADRATRGEFFRILMKDWPSYRDAMAYRYSSHDANEHRPSPMAFSHEMKAIVALWKAQMAPPKIKKAGGTNFHSGF